MRVTDCIMRDIQPEMLQCCRNVPSYTGTLKVTIKYIVLEFLDCRGYYAKGMKDALSNL